MNSTRAMLTVLMDGIRDANMWLESAKTAAEANKPDESNWFKTHARKRIEALDADYDYIKDKTGIVAKVKAGDEIADSLHQHIVAQMKDLHARLEAMR